MVTRTVRVFEPSFRLRVSQGESLEHTVTFQTNAAVFSIIDDETHTVLLSQDDPGPVFHTTWQGEVGSSTAHGFACSFVAAIRYTWKAEIVASNGARTTVVDIDYASNDGTDVAADAILIRVR